jgi:hypothetical protein
MGLSRRIAVPVLALVLLASFVAPARGQFEEEDTLPRFDAGLFLDFNFRGTRGQTLGGVEVKLNNSLAVGLRFDYRATGTLTLGAFGSYSRTDEKLTSQDGTVATGIANFNIFQFGGELLLRVKPQIPGYFILGGGAQHVTSAGDDPQITDPGSFTEPFGIIGAGYEFASTRRRAFRINLRFHLINPSEQLNAEPKSISVDFVLGAAFILRF